MEKKFFFFDVDNTLTIWPQGTMPEDTLYALDGLREAGHRLALATGRLQADSLRFGRTAGIADIVADGGYSVTIDNELIYMKPLERSACLAYIDQLEEAGIRWAVITENEIERITPYDEVAGKVRPWDVMRTVHDAAFDYREVRDFYKIFTYFATPEQQAFPLRFFGLKGMYFGTEAVLIEPMKKSVGVKYMADHYGVRYEDVVVFGDGVNDLSLFDSAWMNIAMGNAKDVLKEKADYVTADCDKGGILQAVRRFGWIRE